MLSFFFLLCGICSIARSQPSWAQLGSDIIGKANEEVGIPDFSGHSVSISSDGSIVAIGAPWGQGNGYNAGLARVFQYVAGAWVQLGSDINGKAPYDYVGYSVSLSSNGHILAVSLSDIDGANYGSGSVRLYKYEPSPGTWVQMGADIEGRDGDYFGRPVSLSSDGTVVAIGAPYNLNMSSYVGHVRVFRYVLGSWVQLGSDIKSDRPGDGTGKGLSLSADGNIVAIGTPSSWRYANGYVKVFRYTSGSWEEMGINVTENGYDKWLSLSADGNVVAVAARSAVRIFRFVQGSWLQLGSDTDAIPDRPIDTVSLSSDGSTVAVGAPWTDSDNRGNVRVLRYVSGSWMQLNITIEGTTYNEYCGYSVSLSSDGSVLAIGATGGANFAGATRVYRYGPEPSSTPTPSPSKRMQVMPRCSAFQGNTTIAFQKLDGMNCVYSRIPTVGASGDGYKYLGNFDSYEECAQSTNIPPEAQAITYHSLDYGTDDEGDWSGNCYSINDQDTQVQEFNTFCGLRIN